MSTLWLPEREKSYVIFAFTGQGEQHPEMLMSWYDHPSASIESALNVFHEETGVPWEKPLDPKLLAKGPLMQPANVTLGVIVNTALQEAGVIPNETFGHSLGEYGAMVSAGFVEPTDAIRLSAKRGIFTDMNIREMIQRGEFTGMMALTAKTGAVLESILEAIQADEAEEYDVGNDNTEGQVVLSGTLDAMRKAVPTIIEKSGRVVELQVDGSYHSKKMKLASQLMRKEVDNLPIRRGRKARLYSPTHVREIRTREDLANTLVLQLTHSVYWKQLIKQRLGYLNSEKISTKFRDEGGEEILFVEVGADKSGRANNKGTLIGMSERNARGFHTGETPIRYVRCSTAQDLALSA